METNIYKAVNLVIGGFSTLAEAVQVKLDEIKAKASEFILRGERADDSVSLKAKTIASDVVNFLDPQPYKLPLPAKIKN